MNATSSTTSADAGADRLEQDWRTFARLLGQAYADELHVPLLQLMLTPDEREAVGWQSFLDSQGERWIKPEALYWRGLQRF